MHYEVLPQIAGSELNLLLIEAMMQTMVTKFVKALGLVVIGLAIAAVGIYLGETDDAPGAALIGILLMFGAMALAVRTALRATPFPPNNART